MISQTLIQSGKLKKGDKILLTIAEHHANIVPRQMLERHGIEVLFVGITEEYGIDFDDFQKKYDEHVKVVASTYVSNVTGAIFDVQHL